MKKLLVLLFATLVPGTIAVAATDGAIPGPAVGAEFPHSLNAPDQRGQDQSLDTLMGENGLVLVFVRSADWCRFCKAQLVDLNQRLPEFQALGLNVVAISVDEVAQIAKFSETQQIRFTLLADASGDINLQLGIRDTKYPVGDMAFGVPSPILYVVDQTGTISARYMEPTYRTRPDLDVVLRNATALQD